MPMGGTSASTAVLAQPAVSTTLAVDNRAGWPLVKKPLPPLYFGGLAACAATFFTHPLGTVKVQLQTAKGMSGNNMGYHVAKAIYREQGVLSFYNGISAAILRQMTYAMARFSAYDVLKKKLTLEDGSLPFYRMAFAGVVAGAIGGICGTPADIVLIRLQNDGSLPVEKRRNYKNAFDGVIRIAREEGGSELLKGVIPNMSRAIMMTGAQLCSYDVFKQLLLTTPYFNDNLGMHFSASFLTAFVAVTATSPFDVVNTRIMNAGPTSPYKNLVQAMAVIVKEEGPQALYKGWTPAFVRTTPQTILIFMFLEQFRNIYWNRYAVRNKVRYE